MQFRDMTTGQFEAWRRDRQITIAPPLRAKAVIAKPAPTPPPALQALFETIQILATRGQWTNQYTYNADGDDAGLHVILVRDVVLFAEVTLTPDTLTEHQQAWLAAIRTTGQAEAYAWTPADMPQIRERLGRKQGNDEGSRQA